MPSIWQDFVAGDTLGTGTELMYELILSLKHGGLAELKTYCKFYYQRPPKLFGLLCINCGDRDTCTTNTPHVGKERKRTGVKYSIKPRTMGKKKESNTAALPSPDLE